MSNSLSNAHMSEPSRLGRRVGDRWIFALEFDIQGDLPRAWNEMLGSLWLWTRGHLVARQMKSRQSRLASICYKRRPPRTANEQVEFYLSAMDEKLWKK